MIISLPEFGLFGFKGTKLGLKEGKILTFHIPLHSSINTPITHD